MRTTWEVRRIDGDRWLPAGLGLVRLLLILEDSELVSMPKRMLEQASRPIRLARINIECRVVMSE